MPTAPSRKLARRSNARGLFSGLARLADVQSRRACARRRGPRCLGIRSVDLPIQHFLLLAFAAQRAAVAAAGIRLHHAPSSMPTLRPSVPFFVPKHCAALPPHDQPSDSAGARPGDDAQISLRKRVPHARRESPIDPADGPEHQLPGSSSAFAT
jgi:hypothetical protein